MRKSIVMASVALSAALLISSAASAGTNLVQNGSFDLTTDGSTSHEFGASFTFGQDVSNWTSASTSAFNLYFTPGQATGPADVPTRFGEHGQFLWVLPPNDPDGGNFVALDGDTNFNGALTQTIDNLTAGAKYVVSFDWATAQYADRSGDTTEQLQVGFGGAPTQSTGIVTNPSEGATAWQKESFTFTATGASQVLSFLSIGAPAGQPPVALLDGVSLTAVPEPATWGMMLVGFGGLGVVIRRRRALATA
jgi:PEP-CTERM motif/Protein of unknown function (DUF642)